LIGAGDLAAIGHHLGIPGSRGYIDDVIAQETLLGQHRPRVSPYAILHFVRVNGHRDQDWFVVLAGWDRAELDLFDLAHEFACQTHFVPILEPVSSGKSGLISQLAFEKGDVAAHAENKDYQYGDSANCQQANSKL
jgi:hypothetical protein